MSLHSLIYSLLEHSTLSIFFFFLIFSIYSLIFLLVPLVLLHFSLFSHHSPLYYFFSDFFFTCSILTFFPFFIISCHMFSFLLSFKLIVTSSTHVLNPVFFHTISLFPVFGCKSFLCLWSCLFFCPFAIYFFFIRYLLLLSFFLSLTRPHVNYTHTCSLLYFFVIYFRILLVYSFDLFYFFIFLSALFLHVVVPDILLSTFSITSSLSLLISPSFPRSLLSLSHVAIFSIPAL